MTRLLSGTLLLSVVLAGLLIPVGPWGSAVTFSADPDKVPATGGSGQHELSPEEAAGGKQNLQQMRKACDEDVKKLCPDIRPGGGRILQCLRGQESNLTPACREVLAPRSSNR